MTPAHTGKYLARGELAELVECQPRSLARMNGASPHTAPEADDEIDFEAILGSTTKRGK